MASQTETTLPEGSGLLSRPLVCQVVTPEKTVFAKTVDFVALPLYDGELGVLPGRSPLLGRLGYGELRIKVDGGTESYFVDGGFAQVRENTVTVLTNRAIPAAKIETNGTAERLDELLKRPAVTDAEVAEKSKAVSQLRAMLHISNKP
ncbi:ATP synthase F1 subunit epsilon [Planctomyces sp. SH-PL62]|uniref:ATP synthase F1 subunit epsilon n=1 Tax=Planctomyces sp. SH-PL62 TaxID=1636152 RepID=UPI00078C7474|nr:ATP synthase F1 subunit epsilon [Planctomyces sp. SH-PL62]AMV36682.1 ATP synthase epsilon chain, sodium ion specific [Planctomyces sp. SH-PL62]